MNTMIVVQSRDVDGMAPPRSYKVAANAVARFERMAGYSFANAVAEQFHMLETPPTLEQFIARGGSVRAVSMFGTVVTIDFPKPEAL